MSQMAPEAPPRRRDNAFTRKIGPLPMWAWLAIIATALIIWGVYSARKNAQASQQQASTTNASDVPDFILQDYQQTGPPGPPGPPGPSGSPPPGGGGGSGPQFTPVTPGPNAVTPITNPGGNVRGGGTPARPVTAGPVQYGTGPEKAAPVRARGNVRTSPKAPHPARKPAPRHTAPRHPARG